MDAIEKVSSNSIQVITRAAKILRLLGKQTNGLSLGQIAGQVQLPRSTVQRIVSALAEEGFVSNKNGNASIRLGPGIEQLAKASDVSMKDRLLPIMRRLSKRTGETVDLAILENARMRFIAQIEGSQRLRTVSRIGDAFPLTSTANGKAALACLEKTSAMEHMKNELGVANANGKTIKRLIAEVEGIRNGDLAEDNNEHSDGISALGYAFQNDNGDIYALSVPVPTTRYRVDKSKLAKAIRGEISKLS